MTFREWFKSLGVKLADGAVLGILGLVLAALLKGERLNGLTNLKSLGRVLKSEVPLWWLAIAVVLSIVAVALAGWLRTKSTRGKAIPGLTSYFDRFSQYDYEQSMNSNDLLMIFNDGKSWVASHRESLERRVLERKQRVRILILHPRSAFMPTLIRKADRTMDDELRLLHQSFLFLDSLRERSGGLVEVRGHFLFNPYVLHLTESLALVHLYFINERGELPLLVFKKSEQNDGLYEQYRSDAEKVWGAALPLKVEDFTPNAEDTR